MEIILRLMGVVSGLKGVPRVGFNLKFPPDSEFSSRKVENAESVADHSYGLVMLAFVMAEMLGVERERFVLMALVHDLPEERVGDIVVHYEQDPVRKKALVAQKRAEEEHAMAQIAVELGVFGERLQRLWEEYQANETREAQLLRELDKLEFLLQTIEYARSGEIIAPLEIAPNIRKHLRHPLIIELFEAAVAGLDAVDE